MAGKQHLRSQGPEAQEAGDPLPVVAQALVEKGHPQVGVARAGHGVATDQHAPGRPPQHRRIRRFGLASPEQLEPLAVHRQGQALIEGSAGRHRPRRFVDFEAEGAGVVQPFVRTLDHETSGAGAAHNLRPDKGGVSANVVAVVMGVEKKTHRPVREPPQLGQQRLGGARGHLAVDDEHATGKEQDGRVTEVPAIEPHVRPDPMQAQIAALMRMPRPEPPQRSQRAEEAIERGHVSGEGAQTQNARSGSLPSLSDRSDPPRGGDLRY